RSHLIYELGLSPERAEDLLQGFVADKVLEKDLLARADKDRGKFRSFVLKTLDNYVMGVRRKRQARKRKPERAGPIEGIKHGLSAGDAERPSFVFDTRWAREVLDGTVRRMKDHCCNTGRQDIWGVFRCRILEPTLRNQDPLPYGELVERFQLESPSQAYNVLASGKRIFRRCLRSVIAEYASGEEQVEAEIMDLRRVVSQAGGQPRW
ncbi:MAG: hypothetical protein ACOCSQ_04610, partial [Planctomycetota bacterium]